MDLELILGRTKMNKRLERLQPLQDNGKKIDPRNSLNDLNSTEWMPETVSVWNQKGLGANHPDAAIERQHPAPFSFTDVSRLIRFFTKKGGVVLDPFVGVGSTLKACAVEGRKGIGFELNQKYAALANQRLQTEVRDFFATVEDQEIRIGDSRDLVPELNKNSVDFVVTSPPYWNILHKEDHKAKQERIENNLDTKYGDDLRDLGKRQMNSSFQGVVFGLSLSTVENFHSWEVRNDDGGTNRPLAWDHRQAGGKRTERGGVLPGGTHPPGTFLFLAPQVQ